MLDRVETERQVARRLYGQMPLTPNVAREDCVQHQWAPHTTQIASRQRRREEVIRSRALEHFRKTVGLETGSAVNVNVNQRTTVSNDQPCCFEQVMDRVRAKLVAERREQRQIAAAPENCRGEPESAR